MSFVEIAGWTSWKHSWQVVKNYSCNSFVDQQSQNKTQENFDLLIAEITFFILKKL